MYGVESFVHPDYQGSGVGSKLMDARAGVVRRYNLRGIVAGSLIIDYHKVADHITPEQYVAEVVAGTRFDTNLTKQLKKGFKAGSVIPNYTYDERSKDYGVAIMWLNPAYVKKHSARIIPFDASRLQPSSAVGG